ncbi:hypothetical protein RN001_005680 [Aquatica leii]|uniref:EB domain-containing protein n=1 Tax=Aquatica leii TaxID=1421715 RepID=A0AAN7SAQ4_9COLE|nr:hypothetical protein RN001_005680 [Aquatica leii]
MKRSLIISLIVLVNNNITRTTADDGEGELNASCNSDKDCRYFGYLCKQNTCQCDQWYIPDKDNKICVGGVDQKCLYDEHCIDGAYCMNQVICKCKRDKSHILDQGFVCAGNSTAHQITVLLLLATTISGIFTII